MTRGRITAKSLMQETDHPANKGVQRRVWATSLVRSEVIKRAGNVNIPAWRESAEVVRWGANRLSSLVRFYGLWFQSQRVGLRTRISNTNKASPSLSEPPGDSFWDMRTNDLTMSAKSPGLSG